MSTDPAIVDISSDEDDFEFYERACQPNYDLISKILSCVNRVVAKQSDDIIVLDEFSTAPTPKERNSSSARLADPSTEDSDDDCLVLDSDPDKLVSLTNERDDKDDSEDLLVVGETGQVACRDYPHSRHLCASFPFSTTAHERHCSLCHCYVCDSPAPCAYWGNGLSSTDHCHSTDKEAMWKDERTSFKQRRNQSTQNQNSQSQLNPRLSMVAPPQSIQQTCSSNSIPRSSYGTLAPRRNQHNALLRSIPYSKPHLRACSTPKAATSTPLRERNHDLQPVAFPIYDLSKPTTMLQMPPVQREKRSVIPPIMQAYSRAKKFRTAGNDSVCMSSLQRQSSIASCGSTYSATSEKTKVALTASEKDDSMLFWQEILANVASQLEVSVSDTEATTINGQPQDGSSQPLGFADSLQPQPNASQTITNLCQHSTPASIMPTTEPNSLGISCSYMFGDFVPDSDPVTVTEPNPPANIVPVSGEPHLGNDFASILEDITPNTVTDVDPLSLFNEGDIAWDRLAEL